LAGRINKQRKKRHVKKNGFGIEQGDHHCLPQKMVRLDVQHRGRTRLGKQHLRAQPRKVSGTQPLYRMKGFRIGREQGGYACNSRPHQYLVTQNHTKSCRQPTLDAALAGGGDQCQIARPRYQQEHDNGDDKSGVVGDSEHGFLSTGEGCEFTLE
jgi:hypothetical protein